MVIYWDVLIECLAYSHRSKWSWKNRAERGAAEMEQLAAELFAARCLSHGTGAKPDSKVVAPTWLLRDIEWTPPENHLIGSDHTAAAAGFVHHPARQPQT